jgi:hypothetical protein
MWKEAAVAYFKVLSQCSTFVNTVMNSEGSEYIKARDFMTT